MYHPILCRCGRLEGRLSASRPFNRCRCYCADCQAFARFLGQAEWVLDENGGSDLIQTTPSGITLTRGRDQLACVRLSPRGMRRWYAACCHTPIGNTLASRQLPFVGLSHGCLEDGATTIEARFGPTRMITHTGSAIGRKAPASGGVMGGTLKIIALMTKERLTGRYRQTPFFDASGTPVVAPRVLTPTERAALKRLPV